MRKEKKQTQEKLGAKRSNDKPYVRFEVNVKRNKNKRFSISSDRTCGTLAALTLILNIQQRRIFSLPVKTLF